MLKKNRSAPNTAVIPVLYYPDVREAVEWLTTALPFTERLRIADHRCQLSHSNGAIVLVKPGGHADAASSTLQGPGAHSVQLRGTAPPGAAARCPEQATQERSGRQLECPFGENSALRSVPDMKGRPRVFSQKLLQPQLIGSVHRALSAKAGSHQLSNVAVPGDGHSDHCPLRHS